MSDDADRSADSPIFDIDGQEDFEGLGAGIAMMMSPSTWEGASETEREALVKRIGDFARMRFGLDTSEVAIDDLPAGQLGAYDARTDVITVSSELLMSDDPSRVLSTLLHEVRHALQTAVTEGLVPHPLGGNAEAKIAIWRSATEDYDSNDLVAYMYSPLETDARAAASGAVAGYWKCAYDEVYAEHEEADADD